MANRSTSFGKIARRAPEIARLRLLNALKGSRGNIWGAARTVSLSVQQVQRYLSRFNLRPQLQEIRDKTGWRQPEARKGQRLDRWTRKRKRHLPRQSTRVDLPESAWK